MNVYIVFKQYRHENPMIMRTYLSLEDAERCVMNFTGTLPTNYHLDENGFPYAQCSMFDVFIKKSEVL